MSFLISTSQLALHSSLVSLCCAHFTRTDPQVTNSQLSLFLLAIFHSEISACVLQAQLAPCLLLRIASCYSVVLFHNAGFLCALAIKYMKKKKSSPYWAGPRQWNQMGSKQWYKNNQCFYYQAKIFPHRISKMKNALFLKIYTVLGSSLKVYYLSQFNVQFSTYLSMYMYICTYKCDTETALQCNCN